MCMAILVIGGAGYIGSHTVVELLKNNREVIIVDNFSNSKPEMLEKIKKITNKVSDMDAQLSSSTGLITEMDRREKRNNILVIFAITLLVIFFGILIIRILPKVSSANTISVDLTKDENVTSLSEEWKVYLIIRATLFNAIILLF